MSKKGLVNAVDLRAGDTLWTVNGEYVIIQKIQHEILEIPIKVYNFKVANNHTYFVGSSAVGVHNASCITLDSNSTLNDILNDSEPGNKTKGSTTQYNRSGGYDQATSDFNSLQLEGVKEIKVSSGGEGKVGTLSDGRNVILRSTSTEGSPTLEVQSNNSNAKIKIRYN